VSEIGSPGVYRGGGKLKRFPDVSRADKQLLDQLEPSAAREFRQTLRAEARSDRRQRRIVRKLRDIYDQPRAGRRRATHPPHE
jgi:hypothetical protein